MTRTLAPRIRTRRMAPVLLLFLLPVTALLSAQAPAPVEAPVAAAEGGDGGVALLGIPEHDTFESIALADWMLRLGYLLAVLFTTGFAAVLPFVPWMIRVRGVQRGAYGAYSAGVHGYFYTLHGLWSVRWLLAAGAVVAAVALFGLLLSYGAERLVE